MNKKRPSLEKLLQNDDYIEQHNHKKNNSVKRPHVKQQTAYLPIDIYEQLRKLAFEERKKMHDYLLEGLDLVFKDRGLPSIQELKRK